MPYWFPEQKDIQWIAVEEILNNWGSIDSDGGDHRRCSRKEWEELLNFKRSDRDYRKIFPILQEEGFRMPLNAYRKPSGKVWYHGNGHHRLAAAIDLGYTHVPYALSPRGCNDQYWDIEDFEGFDFTPPEGITIPPITKFEVNYKHETDG